MMMVDEEDVPMLIDARDVQDEEPSSSFNTLQRRDTDATRVPLTIITGYLGAGKTTLVNHILTEQHGKKIAVILNEFGDSADIEKALTVGEDGQQVEEWLELSNGCICCSIKYLTPSHINYSQIRADVLRDSGVAAIESLISRSGAFDYVILETSGLADPGNLAPLFWVDEGLGSSIYLDGIVTLVDVKNILLSLNEIPLENEHDSHKGPYMTTAHLQISHADIILLNKSDTITAEQLEAVEDRVRGINGLAKMYITNYSQVPRLEGFLLDLHAYDGLDALNISSKGHSHLDPTISTFSLPVPLLSTEQLLSLETWLQSLLWESILPLPATQSTNQPNFSIHRLKGRVSSVSGETKMIQGVRDVFEMVSFDPAKSSGQARNGKYDRGEDKIVLIGRGLADLPLESSLRFSLNQSASDSSA